MIEFNHLRWNIFTIENISEIFSWLNSNSVTQFWYSLYSIWNISEQFIPKGPTVSTLNWDEIFLTLLDLIQYIVWNIFQ